MTVIPDSIRNPCTELLFLLREEEPTGEAAPLPLRTHLPARSQNANLSNRTTPSVVGRSQFFHEASVLWGRRLLYRCGDEGFEERVWIEWTGLEFWVVLGTHEERVSARW